VPFLLILIALPQLRHDSGGRKVILSPDGAAIFSSVAKVGFPGPLSNADKIRGETSAIFIA
jgi:hypothetical protein